MSLVLDFLVESGSRLNLDRHGAAGPLTAVWLTPRFRASAHTVALLLPAGGRAPVLVAKVPRLREADTALVREAANLRALAAGRDAGVPGTPSLVAFERFRGWPILVQSALDGRAWDRARVRRDPDGAARAGIDWLAHLHGGGRPAAAGEIDWHDRVIGRPLAALAEMAGAAGSLAAGAAVTAQVRRTLDVAEAVRRAPVPLVMEHGDFSAPNVMALPGGRMGVVDWELADPRGLPACDAFFWLTYVAFARSGATRLPEQVAAFTDAFWGPSAWARPHVARYAGAVGLDGAWLTPLFVLTWARTVAGIATRLDQVGSGQRSVDARTVAWLDENRYSALWRVVLDRAAELSWEPAVDRTTVGRDTDRRPAPTRRLEKARSRWLAWR